MITHLDDTLIESIFKKYGRNVSSISFANNGLRCIRKIECFASTLESLNLSKNELTDISALGLLENLKSLDISENNITDIGPLARLIYLQSLRLSFNNISSLAALKPLSSLVHLSSLFLIGNPVCKQSGYLRYVKSLLPALKYLDEIDMDLIDADTNKSPEWNQGHLFDRSYDKTGSSTSPMGREPNPRHMTTRLSTEESTSIDYTRNNNKIPGQLESSSELDSLKLQVQALESVVELQERTVSNAAATANISSAVDQPQELLHAKECFPYLQLLQLWRKKYLRSVIELKTLQRDLLRETSRGKRERQALRAQAMDADGQVVSWKNRYAATVEKLEKQNSRVEVLEEALKKEHTGRMQAEQRLQASEKSLNLLKVNLKTYKTSMDDNWIRNQVQVMKTMDKLKEMELRLTAAADRVALASALVAQKEVILRNTAAAIEADRRKGLQAIRGQVSPAVDGPGSGIGSASREAVTNYNSGGVFISDVRIRPESESLLRALFRALDPDDVGIVAVSLLAESIGIVSTSPSYDTNSIVNIKYSEIPEGRHDDATQLGHVVMNAVGAALWNCLVENIHRVLKQTSESSLTWGEFLLLLMPNQQDNPEGSRSALTRSDMQSLHSQKIWGDVQWSMIPLQLPPSSSSSSSVIARYYPASSHNPDFENSPHLQAEIARLASERSYLLRRIQELIRTLDRRVEAARDFFAADIAKMQTRESRWKLENDELSARQSALQTRLSEMQTSFDLSKEKMDGRIHALEIENQKLIDELGLSRGDQMKKFEMEFNEEKARYTKLETEHSVLQRELGKKEVRVKGLQRDVTRLQAAIQGPKEEASAALRQRDEIGNQLHEKECEIMALKQQLDDQQKINQENNELHRRIDVLERALMIFSEEKRRDLPFAADENQGTATTGHKVLSQIDDLRALLLPTATSSGTTFAQAQASAEKDTARTTIGLSHGEERQRPIGSEPAIAVPNASGNYENSSHTMINQQAGFNHPPNHAVHNADKVNSVPVVMANSSSLYLAQLSKLKRYAEELLQS